MQSEWKKYRLGELYEVHNGLSKGRKFFGRGYPFLSFSTVFNRYFLPEKLTDLVESTEKERETLSIHRGDVFITRTSETYDELGMSCVALKDYPNATFNGFTKRLRPIEEGRVLPEYIGYFLRSPQFRKKFEQIANVTTRASLSNGDLLNMEVSLPPLPIQRKLASILSALDDKIETNNAICRNLEDQSMAVFKRCFFTHSEQLVEDKPVYDFAEYINGAAFKQHEYGESGLPIIKIAELKSGLSSSTLFYRGEDKDEKYYIQNGDILFSWSGNPETSIDVFIWTRGDAILNQHIFNVKSRYEAKWFTYLMLKNYMPVFAKIASDKQTTGLGHVTVADLKRLTFPYNTNQILDFEKEVSIYMEQVYNTLVMNNHLTNLRDTLLPKLMNGELEVETLV